MAALQYNNMRKIIFAAPVFMMKQPHLALLVGTLRR